MAVKKRRDIAMIAAAAQSDLNIFAAIVEILKGGLITSESSSAQRSAERIRGLCLAEMRRQFRLYDAALDKLEHPNAD